VPKLFTNTGLLTYVYYDTIRVDVFNSYSYIGYVLYDSIDPIFLYGAPIYSTIFFTFFDWELVANKLLFLFAIIL
jgi:hypothetical protein